MTLRKAAEQALEALVLWEDEAPHWWSEADAKAVAALRAALVEPNKCTHGVTDGNCKECYMAEPEQEPLEYWNAVEGWVKIDEVRQHFDSVGCGTIYKTSGDGRKPLYTAPPQRKPLSDEEIEQAYRHIWRNIPADFDHTSMGWIEQGIRYAEQAHGIKGEA